MSATLLPCPFCGGEAFLRDNGGGLFYASCINVGCDVRPYTDSFGAKGRVVAAWNRRTPTDTPDGSET